MSFHPPGEGSVHREYLPAGTGVPAMTRSALVSNTVAWFAPVRHTWFQGTTFPKITRPRVEGLDFAALGKGFAPRSLGVLSPPDSVKANVAGAALAVRYSRPS